MNIGDKAPAALEPLSEAELCSHWESDDIVVSVLCATYNHADFIASALDGFFGQRTRFRFEVIVRDDASNDGTTDLIRQYQARYPGILRVVYETCNQWPARKPGRILRGMARGRYIATCEGDDYWIDPLKLQKQVEYLEHHGEVSLLVTPSLYVENGVIFDRVDHGGTRTFMFRRYRDFPEDLSAKCYFGDSLATAFLKSKGRMAYLTEPTAVWRKHRAGVFGYLGQDDQRFLDLKRAETKLWSSVCFTRYGLSDKAEQYRMLALDDFMKAADIDSLQLIKHRLRGTFLRWRRRFSGLLALGRTSGERES